MEFKNEKLYLSNELRKQLRREEKNANLFFYDKEHLNKLEEKLNSINQEKHKKSYNKARKFHN